METLLKDLRYGIRSLLKQPAFAFVAVLSIALGIGVNTTIFSFVNATLFRPLPFPESDKLVRLWDGNAASYPDYVAYRDDSKVFSSLVAYAQRPLSLNVNGESERIFGEIVTGNYFDVLKVKPAIGRGFLQEEDRTPGTHPVVVLSNGLWRRQFNSDPAIIGKGIKLNNYSFTVIGVMPEKFVGATLISPPDVWVPMMMEPIVDPGSRSLTSPDEGWLMMLGRLQPEVKLAGAQAAVETIASRLHQARRERNSGPEQMERRIVAVAEARGLMVPPAGRVPALLAITIVMAVVALVLLVACANVANMLLARAVARRKEIAVRLALGAGRWRIIRQMLTESVLLSLIGGVGGLLLAGWSTNLLATLLPQSFPGNSIAPDVSLDARVFLYTFLLSTVTGVIFGLAPALQSSKPDVIATLKDQAVTFGRGRTRFTLRNLLVVTQVAISMLLLVSAGLFLRNLRNTQHPEPGFVTDNGLMMSFDLGLARYDKARGQIFEEQLLQRVRSLPQIQAASLAEFVPLTDAGSLTPLYVEGEPTPDRFDDDSLLSNNTVGLDYFRTMGIPFVKGRDFNSSDTASSPEVIIVNETLARRLSPDGNAVGKRIRMDSQGDYLEVVGVVRDIKYRQLSEKPPFFGYLPLSQRYRSSMTLHVRTPSDPVAAINQLRAEIKALDSELPLTGVKTMQEHMRLPLAPAKLLALLSSTFGILALLLASIGLYGVMAYVVGSRTREIGIRMALGAQTSGVRRLVIVQGMRLALTGVAVGVVAALALTRVLSGVLYGVSATDPFTFAGVVVLLASVALLACLVPAWRATKVDPLVALRYE
ncbi:MAG TPA: ABC transporter permease [Pyrinomonadaceae bacterium]|nr:ABC transporter permease [Pyrinomonadaceae bacterium]